MGLLTPLFRLPFLPVRGVAWLAELIRDEAEQELHNPARVRRQLEEAEQERRTGQISEDELSGVEAAATARMYAPKEPLADPADQGHPPTTDHGDRS